MPAQELMSSDLPGCSIALKCADDFAIERCLDSIDDDVSVNVVITPNERIAAILREREVPYSITEYGNIAKSTEIGVNEAEYDNVIVMDSDTWFMPGSIRLLREALQANTMAKADVQFLGDTAMAKLIARARHRFNSQSNYVTNPGLAMRKQEVRELCNGYIFNPLIRWTEDADLNYRAQKAGIEVAFVPEAVVLHEPIGLNHELKAAFLYGVGKRLSVEHTPGREPVEEFPEIILDALNAVLPKNAASKIICDGLDIALLDTAWRVAYLSGYHAQKNTGHWTLKA